MKKTLLFFLIGSLMSITSYSQPLGQFEDHTDIGTVERKGFVRYDSDQQRYHIGGAGQNMWADHDDFHFIYKQIDGDFLLTARFEFIGKGVNPHRKVGWMVRQSLDPDAMYADAVIHGDGLTSLQFRPQKGDNTKEIQSQISSPDFIQFERLGDTFIMRTAKFGFPMQEVGRVHLPMDEDIYTGVAICSHEKGVLEEAMLTNVRFTKTAPKDFQPYQDFSGSRLETINVENGERRILYTSPEPLEAPNWTPDSEALIYNSKGLLYRFNLQDKNPEQIDTGFATQCNNDHVISFDGTQLAISHHTETESQSGSMIYTLPVRGGTPQKVTDKAPSYLHGWSPDGQTLVYTAKRNGVFNIYKIPVNGGEETQLTDTETLDDGPEYTPDGKWIYFNSARKGTMEIWRMKPDGSEQQQLTFDGYNNWFPHISPDGQTVLFLSYPPHIDAQDHPHYKHVTLRTMPLNGGFPRTIAYIYGGQGTINVPSWSPDSKKAAFVSYSFGIK